MEGKTLSTLLLLTALFLLNSALTFHNRWPTLGVQLEPELSIELAILVLILVLVAAWRGRPSHRLERILLGTYALLTLSRYAEVTAPALVGRRINLYWDGQHIPAVLAMMINGISWWQLVAWIAVVLALAMLVLITLRWAIGVVMAMLSQSSGRRYLGVYAVGVTFLFIAGHASRNLPTERWFSLPVTGMFVEQANFILAATVFKDNSKIVATPAVVKSDLGRLRGADVFIIFHESYGTTVFDEPTYTHQLAGDYAIMEQRLHRSGWHTASARVISTTFGGASWLAHASFLAGIRIEDQSDYQLLLTTERANLVDRFLESGYRCIALMPGLKRAWPEGHYYGFDHVYNATNLDYHGPAFGWWNIPDQFSLYRVHQQEISRNDRVPLLIFFTTITSHIPFAPVAPYQPHWAKLTTENPYLAPNLQATLNRQTSIADLSPAYIRTIRYNLEVLTGYLIEHAPTDAFFLVLGDHQPPALVSGQRASWQVPVHIFSRDAVLIAAFLDAGFNPGLVPDERVMGGIEMLTPLFLTLLDSGSELHWGQAATTVVQGKR